MAITFRIIPHRIAGAKCPSSIVPEEREANGEKSIMLRCNLCGQAMGTINAAVAPALVLKLLDEIVMHRFDEQDEEESVLPRYRMSVSAKNATVALACLIVRMPETSRCSAFMCAISCDQRAA